MIEWKDNYPDCNLPPKSGKTLAESWETFTERERNLIWTAMEWGHRGQINIALVPFMDSGQVHNTVQGYLQAFMTKEPELMRKLEGRI